MEPTVTDWAEWAALGLRLLARALAPYLAPARPPPIRSVRLIREEPNMALVFAADLPPPSAPDVVKRELEVVVEAGAPEVLDAPAGSAEFMAKDGQAVTLRYRNTDDAGNVGEWSEPFVFTAEDSIVPTSPGQVGVRLVREEPDTPATGPG